MPSVVPDSHINLSNTKIQYELVDNTAQLRHSELQYSILLGTKTKDMYAHQREVKQWYE